jgi:hypothetical protein
MNNNSQDGSEAPDKSNNMTEADLRRLYPQYKAECEYMESRPFIFRYGPLKPIYNLFSNLFNGFIGRVKDRSSPSGWRKPSESEKRQTYRLEEADRRQRRR